MQGMGGIFDPSSMAKAKTHRIAKAYTKERDASTDNNNTP